MSFADIRIIAILVIFISLYGVFNVLYVSNEVTQSGSFSSNNSNAYDHPDTGDFWTTMNSMAAVNTTVPELAFLNATIFLAFSAIVVFLGLRFLRGTG